MEHTGRTAGFPARAPSQELQRVLGTILRERRSLALGIPGARSGGLDPIDMAQDLEEENTWLAVSQCGRELHDQAVEAFRRLGEGRYGTCASCGEPIPPARLSALPFALRCLPCQERFEAGTRGISSSRAWLQPVERP